MPNAAKQTYTNQTIRIFAVLTLFSPYEPDMWDTTQLIDTLKSIWGKQNISFQGSHYNGIAYMFDHVLYMLPLKATHAWNKF